MERNAIGTKTAGIVALEKAEKQIVHRRIHFSVRNQMLVTMDKIIVAVHTKKVVRNKMPDL